MDSPDTDKPTGESSHSAERKSQEIKVLGLLTEWKAGNQSARNELFELLYHELQYVSAALLRHEGNVSLSTDDVVNEAAMRLLNLREIDWNNKAHFMALAAKMMRRVLIDHARRKHSEKRQHEKVTLNTQAMRHTEKPMDLMQLEHALTDLHAFDQKHADIVELRYFGGLSLEEIAEVLNISRSTAQRGWRAARAWLQLAIEEDN